MRVLVTGSRGFIGKNLLFRMGELGGYEIVEFNRSDNIDLLPSLISNVDAIVHLAGENRPTDPSNFKLNNSDLTKVICEATRSAGKAINLILTSSTQATSKNLYGISKLEAELHATKLAEDPRNSVTVYRLPGVFGKWSRPNYNSVVATFCHNLANELPIQINDLNSVISLVYIDDVVSHIISDLHNDDPGLHNDMVQPEYTISLGQLAEQLQAFNNCRTRLISERVGEGFLKKLYATYISYLPSNKFSYTLPKYGDERGIFVEFLKTKDSGQFSYFTAHPGVTRGGHYHHTKSEKFLVLKGTARFGFRNVLSNEAYEIYSSGEIPQVIETVPGWAHDVTNVGDVEMIVMIWASEVFDRERPDTFSYRV